ncbi:hypothetical protein BDB00DRAFT_878931 [Zychaea mexicana]|uniref:uncharacterized protein n=1 Tax=Zychaea mexicana TaxID=64656 RepID=UPI0022FEC05B|nr:uncharacterized protein BDB00DRAFT_878931 [Zychaea mexicana]KAI9484349.1 hypothetical protein BDB00DRAFT_878931 [Zychaea mexicana]
MRHLMDKQMMLRDGKYLKAVHSFKIVKLLGIVNSSLVFTAMYTLYNEYEELRMQHLVPSKALSHLKHAFDTMRSAYDLYAHDQPEIFFTDNIGGDQKFLKDVLPSPTRDAVPVNTPEPVDTSLIDHLPPLTYLTTPVHIDLYCVSHLAHLPPSLITLLSTEIVSKISRQVGGDIRKIKRDFDLHELEPDRSGCKKLPKEEDVRLGDWAAVNLTSEQVHYVALDAFAGFEIYKRIRGYGSIGKRISDSTEAAYDTINPGDDNPDDDQSEDSTSLDSNDDVDNVPHPVSGVDVNSVEFGHMVMCTLPSTASSDNVVRSRVLKDVYHLMAMVRVPRKHGASAEFARKLRDALFIVDSDDKAHVIPPAETLYFIIKQLFESYGPIKCARAGRPLFDNEAWQQARNVLTTIHHGYVSDPPGMSFYYLMRYDKNGLPLYRCCRGTTSLEGSIHQNVIRKFGSFGASPQLADAVLVDYRLRHNIDVGTMNWYGRLHKGHYDPWLLQCIADLRVTLRLPTSQGDAGAHHHALYLTYDKRSAIEAIPAID